MHESMRERNALRTATEFAVDQPLELLLGFVHHWYAMYDAVPTPQDNELRVVEISLSTMLNSRISGNTAGAIWQARAPVQEALAEIPPQVDLLDVPVDGPIPGEQAISRAVTEICHIPRSKLSVATKVLHKKRPGLIPIFDSVVESHYRRWCPSEKGYSWGDYAVALTRWVLKDMHSVALELRALRTMLEKNGTPMTACRILNVLMWAVGSGNEEWLRELVREGEGQPEQRVYKARVEVQAGGRIELNVPAPPGSRAEVVVRAHEADEFADLLAASTSTMGFWDNPQDDAEWSRGYRLSGK
jgi:hypothetical protein